MARTKLRRRQRSAPQACAHLVVRPVRASGLAGAVQPDLASKEVYAAEELTFHNMEIQFKVGKSNATDYLVEKNNDEKALANLVQAKYNYLFKIKVVDYYLGKPLSF